MRAVNNVNKTLAPAIVEKNFRLPNDVSALDKFMIELDGTYNKGKLGANAILVCILIR